MCGIAGNVGRYDDRTKNAVDAMNTAQTHRGPDDVGLWEHVERGGETGVVFGHRRLSIIDLSPLGHQPMVDQQTGCVICFNGEIYNYRQLRAELHETGIEFVSESDTEVVLKALAKYGARALSMLRGMFALALWDPRTGRVLLARDRLGIKPLYYTRGRRDAGARLLFASELRSLLASGFVDRRLDPVGIASYVHNGVVIGPSTAVAGVSLLPAGSYLEVGLDAKPGPPQPFWHLPHHEATSEADAVDLLATALRDAVKMRLVSDVPLGIFLSGGIDSSAIAALAMQGAERPVTTVNIGFDEARYDESRHAQAVARSLGTEHHEVRLSQSRFREQLPAALGCLDQPTFDAINTYLVSAAVREVGLTVALAGTGGDELFGGYSSFRDLGRAARVATAVRPLRGPALEALAGAGTRLKLGPPGLVAPQTRWGKLADALATGGDLFALYQVSYALFTEEFQRELCARLPHDALRHGVPLARALALGEALRGEPTLSAISQLELSFFLGERLLRDTDTASMAVSLEVRVPLIDHRVVEALASVPLAKRYRPLGRKQLLRDLGLRGLDPALFERPKAGFELPLNVWCRQELRSELDQTLRDDALCRRVGIDAKAAARLWQAFQENAPGLYWSRVWALYILLWWAREHRVYL